MKKEIDNKNHEILNLISPQSLHFDSKEFEVSEYFCKAYGIFKYPSRLDYKWLSKITNMENAIVAVSISPVDENAFMDALNKNISNKKAEAETTNKAQVRTRAEKAVEDSLQLIKQIDHDGTTVVNMSVSYITQAEDKILLDRVSRRASSTVASLGAKARLLTRRQDLAFKQCLPTHSAIDDIAQMLDRVIPLSTFVGGFPIASSGFSDNSGDYFGRSLDNSMMMLDIWKRDGDRTNSNFVFMGQPGMGKSTIIKSILIPEFKNGTKIIIIDPEKEYLELCRNLHGDIINVGGSGNSRINPLEIRPVPLDDENEDNPLISEADKEQGLGDLALHLKTLDIFFSLYLPDITGLQRALLKKIVIELYSDFGITWDTDVSQFSHKDFPTFSDLLLLIRKKIEENSTDDLKILEVLLSDIAEGSDSFIFNGHTTINPKSRFIVINTAHLQDTSDELKRTQYFNVLTWAWQQMSNDRHGERVITVADEAYLMIDKKVPQSIAWLRNTSKRCRKYESALIIASHSAVDFLDPEIKMYGQALLDLPTYKIMCGCDGKNLKEIVDLYNLTAAEEAILAKKTRSIALCMIGAKKLGVKFVLPDYRLKLMGSGGGR